MRNSGVFISLFLLAAFLVAGAVEWDSLKVTFGIPIPGTLTDASGKGLNGRGLNSSVFVRQPRSISEISQNWQKLNPSAECSNGLFNGFQYYDNTKPLSVVLLFDSQGTIAGLQTFLPKSEAITPVEPVFRYDLVPMFNNVTQGGIDYLVITVYFVQPETICAAGRSADDLLSTGTGTGVYVQNGTQPSESILVPSNRDDTNSDNGYSENNCGSQMGWHNFFRTEEWDTYNCTVITPIFLLYNNENELHGFGLAMRGTFSAPAYEYPGALAIATLAGNSSGGYPHCTTAMVNTFKVGTLHVYFTSNPQDFECSLTSYVGVVRVVSKYLKESWMGYLTRLSSFSFSDLWQ